MGQEEYSNQNSAPTKSVSAPPLSEHDINQVPSHIPIFSSPQEAQQYYSHDHYHANSTYQSNDNHSLLSNDSMDEKICRCCQDKDPEKDLIAPCHCTGSIKWVHRHCLNRWRTVSPNPQSVYQCDICKSPYAFARPQLSTTSLIKLWLKFTLLVAFDMISLLFLWQLLCLLLSIPYIIYGQVGDLNTVTPWYEMNQYFHNVWFGYYLSGMGTFFFILGWIGLFYGIFKLIVIALRLMSGKSVFETEEERYREVYTYNTYPYYNSWFYDSFFFWYFYPYPLYVPHHHHYYPVTCCYMYNPNVNCMPTDCNIGSIDCNCGNNSDCDPKALLIILAVIVVAFIVLGIIIGTVFMCYMLYQSVRRRIVIIKRKHLSQELEIVDLSQTV